jgi:hypothetical protein
MINFWLIAAGALVAAGAAVLARRTRSSSSDSSSLALPDTAVPPVSSEWLSQVRGKGEPS